MDKIEKFVANFFQDHLATDAWKCLNELINTFEIDTEEAYQVVSRYLGKKWGVYGG